MFYERISSAAIRFGDNHTEQFIVNVIHVGMRH